MSITLEEFQNKKPHLRYDPERRKYIGYRIDVQAGGKRYRNTFRTKGEAEQFIIGLRNKTVYQRAGLKYSGSQSEITLKQLFDQRLARIKNHQERIRARRVFDTFERLFDSPPTVSAVRTSHFHLYINERLAGGVKPETANREINVLSTAFKQAQAIFPQELEDYEPPTIARPKFKKGKRVRHEISETERDAIIQAILTDRLPKREQAIRTESRPIVAEMFRIGWLLGLRFGEVSSLLKSDLKGNELRVVRWKTGEVSYLRPLPDVIVQALQENIDRSKTDKIFNLKCSTNTFASIIKEACTAVGIAYGRNVIDGVTFHSTRHSFTSRLVRVTDIATAGAFTGHSSGEMVDYYAHASDESKSRAMELMYGTTERTMKLEEIFAKVRAGEIDLDTFLRLVK